MLLSLILEKPLVNSMLLCGPWSWTAVILHTVLIRNKRQLLEISIPSSQLEETALWRNSHSGEYFPLASLMS